jgi:hypothetical protein
MVVAHGATMCSSSGFGGRSSTKRWCAVNASSRFERSGALPEMGGGPPKSACRGRLQTTTSCEGKEPSW